MSHLAEFDEIDLADSSEEHVLGICQEALTNREYANRVFETCDRAKAVAAANKALADSATLRKNSAEFVGARFKETMHKVMFDADVKQIKHDYGSFARRGNGGLQPTEVCIAVDQLPERFRKVTITADVDKMRAEATQLGLQELTTVGDDGEVTTFFRLLPRGEQLRIA